MKLSDDVSVMNDIMDFTSSVLLFAEMPLPVKTKAELIFEAEKVLHQMIMDRMIEKCANNAVPCNN